MPLSARQLRFAQFVAEGHTPGFAYQEAGYNVKSDNVAKSAGNRLLTNVDVKAEVARLQRLAELDTVATLEEKRGLMAKIMFNNTEDTRDRIRAADLDSKLAGHYSPQEINITGSIVERIRERNKKRR